MNFFTRELYARFNSPNRAIADEADEQWEAAAAAYQQHLRRIMKLLPDGARALSSLCLHDAELIHPESGASLSEDFAIVMVGIRQGKDRWKVFLIIYSLFDGLHSSPPSRRKPFSRKQVHWLYDELDVSDREKRFVHRVLFSDGRILTIPFTKVSIQTMTMQAKSLADLALKSA